MNINSIAVLLGCAGLLVGGIGLAAQTYSGPSAGVGPVQGARGAWPPHALVAGVEFYDETVQMIRMGPTPRRPADGPQSPARAAAPQSQAQSMPQDDETNIRLIRTIRSPGSRRAQLVEIEFVDQGGRSYRRRYPVEQRVLAAGNRGDEIEADRPALESYGYSPRRSRRHGRGYYRWRW